MCDRALRINTGVMTDAMKRDACFLFVSAGRSHLKSRHGSASWCTPLLGMFMLKQDVCDMYICVYVCTCSETRHVVGISA